MVCVAVLRAFIAATAFRNAATRFGSLANVSQLRRVAVWATASAGKRIDSTRAIHKRLILTFLLSIGRLV